MTLDENVEKELKAARSYAEQGNASGMSNVLALAQMYAQKVGQDITAQVAEIRALVKK